MSEMDWNPNLFSFIWQLSALKKSSIEDIKMKLRQLLFSDCFCLLAATIINAKAESLDVTFENESSFYTISRGVM